jgi:hypothetical protein
LYSRFSDVVWFQTSSLGNTGKHRRPDFYIMKRPYVVWEFTRSMAQLFMRTTLRKFVPAYPEQCLVNAVGLRATPLAHADNGTTCMEGQSLDSLASAAMTSRARAYAFATASCSVAPYAITPGMSVTSAIQRSCDSCSVSKERFTRLLPTPRGGLRSVIALLGCAITHYVARYAGNAVNAGTIARRDGSRHAKLTRRLIPCIQGFQNE